MSLLTRCGAIRDRDSLAHASPFQIPFFPSQENVGVPNLALLPFFPPLMPPDGLAVLQAPVLPAPPPPRELPHGFPAPPLTFIAPARDNDRNWGNEGGPVFQFDFANTDDDLDGTQSTAPPHISVSLPSNSLPSSASARHSTMTTPNRSHDTIQTTRVSTAASCRTPVGSVPSAASTANASGRACTPKRCTPRRPTT